MAAGDGGRLLICGTTRVLGAEAQTAFSSIGASVRPRTPGGSVAAGSNAVFYPAQAVRRRSQGGQPSRWGYTVHDVAGRVQGLAESFDAANRHGGGLADGRTRASG